MKHQCLIVSINTGLITSYLIKYLKRCFEDTRVELVKFSHNFLLFKDI